MSLCTTNNQVTKCDITHSGIKNVLDCCISYWEVSYLAHATAARLTCSSINRRRTTSQLIVMSSRSQYPCLQIIALWVLWKDNRFHLITTSAWVDLLKKRKLLSTFFQYSTFVRCRNGLFSFPFLVSLSSFHWCEGYRLVY